MRISLAVVGSGRGFTENDLALSWFSRLPHKGFFKEVASRHKDLPRRRDDEATRLLSLVPPSGRLIALDPNGTDLSSEKLSSYIADWRLEGFRDAVFAIGGADGHGSDVLARADFRFAFGRATWPHMLFRAMLAEQLYRAEMILLGHPYHRGGS